MRKFALRAALIVAAVSLSTAAFAQARRLPGMTVLDAADVATLKIDSVEVTASATSLNKVTTLTVPFTLFLEDACGSDAGVDSDGVLIGDITASDLETCVTDDGTVFGTADTTDCNDAGADGDVQPFPNTPAVDDAFYVGASSTFAHIFIDIGTQGSTVMTVTWEYSTGAATWDTLTFSTQAVADFDEAAGNHYNIFEPPSDWALGTVDGESMYWVRARVSAFTSTATSALVDQVQLGLVDAGVGINMPVAGSITAANWSARTASGSTANSTFLLMNVTQGTHSLITLTKAVQAGRSDITDLAIVAGDDLVLHQLAEDGSTEFADVNLVLEFAF